MPFKPLNQTNATPGFKPLTTKGFPTEEPEMVKKSFLSQIGNFLSKDVPDFAIGAAKGAVNSARNSAGLVDKALSYQPTKEAMRPIIPGIDLVKKGISAASQIPEQITKNTAEKIGYGTEQVAELFAPIGPAGKAAGETEVVTKLLEKRAAKIAEEASTKVDELVGKIAQGKIEDISKAKVALSNIDIKGVKTYGDLKNALNSQIKAISSKLDNVLGTRPTTKKLDDLVFKTKVGDQVVSHNYVDDAIKQLEEHYSKINDQPNLAKIQQIKTKATAEGLNIKELNDLAKMHGSDLNAFNANGELASGLTKQAVENTRSGLKGTARGLFGDPIYKAADEQISNLYRTRDLVSKVEEAVNTLNQKIQKRNIFQKVGYTAAQIADRFTGGGLKSFVAGLMPRGQGYKVLNALDLEKYLQKNLKKLQELTADGVKEADVIQKLDSFMRGAGEVIKKQATKPVLKK